MNFLTNPRWLFIVNTLPLLVFSWLAWRQYSLIESLLEVDEKGDWLMFAYATALLMVSVTGAGVWLMRKKQRVPVTLVTGLFIATALYTFYGAWSMDDLTPWRIPNWLAGDDLLLYLFTFTMPAMGYGLLTAVHYATPEPEERKIWPNFAGALGIPLAIYAFGALLVPLLGRISGRFFEYFFVIAIVASTVVFLFFLVRGVYLLALSRDHLIEGYRLAWLIPLAIVFPLLGLVINNGHWRPGELRHAGDAVFGDFSHPAFYTMALMNGILLCLPAYENKLYRLFLFLGRSVLLAYIVYFFVVFLPYLPLSIGAILLVGVGFLMLTPLMLLPVQLTAIRDDFRYLKGKFDPKFLIATGVISFLMIPLFITLRYTEDKAALDSALDYVYAPAQANMDALNVNGLERAIAAIDEHKGRRNDFGFATGTPYLSSYYRWLVLDNLTLSDEKLSTLRQVFTGEGKRYATDPVFRDNDQVSLTGATVESAWDPKREAWSSWVNLNLTQADGTLGRGEYQTVFTLLEGVFIDDYYLYVEGVKEHGILAERKAATWVYNNIVRGNRDPGLLRYVTANEIEFKVFPFRAGETRRTGIRFLHREPLTLAFDGEELQLGVENEYPVSGPVTNTSGEQVYLTKEQKGALPQVQRKVGVHFVVDASRRSPETEAAMISRIRDFASKLPPGSPRPRLTLAGTLPQNHDFSASWEAQLGSTEPGGFFAQRAIENILSAELEAPGDTDYQIVVVRNENSYPVFTGDFSAWSAAYPEGDDFYFLDTDNELYHHSLSRNPGDTVGKVASLPAPVAVHKGPAGYYTVDGQGAILPGAETTTDPNGPNDKSWSAAVALRRQYLAHQQSGQTGYHPWLTEVRGSFQQHILMPTTAFLVVENEAQKEALRRKQAETLDADPALDLEETDPVRRMSEPWWIWALGLLVFFIAVVRRQL
ncbi:MSEP-CTERM sorting domain-containing protein [Neolewinella aurantiaca]|uniref:MSEP-CTERM sorting domain-containing protein n=1 Tax=Neolewinella aurantiaca TaxID=2602767 RepID=A0A5C7FWL8_9BACT|nr:MSEP-CTERM sorting domain-containing protein [Neolewinella aurantiaca]TXF90802.1 MSEP-CTERM sorting domain-containing protein [Neolewinella aurantiaca]